MNAKLSTALFSVALCTVGCTFKVQDGPNLATSSSSSVGSTTPSTPATTSTPNPSGADTQNTDRTSDAGQSSGVSTTTSASNTMNTSSTSTTSSSSSASSNASSGVERGNSETSGTSNTDSREAKLDERLDRYMDDYFSNVPTTRMRGDVLVTRDGAVAAEGSYYEVPGQRYSLGTLTEVFTAVAIRQLENESKLKLDDAVRKYIPELPERFDSVTIRQLLSHRGGTGDFLDDEDMFEASTKGQTRAQMIARIAGKPLAFKPGTQSRYSNSGYYLLGIVIERVSSQDLDRYFDSKIFKPAKMTQSDLKDTNIAKGHMRDMHEVVEAPRSHPSVSFAAGGIYSTAQDVQAFARALLSGELLPKNMVEEMWKEQSEVDGIKYGMGFMLFDVPGVGRVVGHEGVNYGHRANWLMTPDGLWSSVALSNLSSVNVDKISKDVLKMAATDKYVKPIMEFDPELAKAVVGTYKIDPKQIPELEKTFRKEELEAIGTLKWSDKGAYVLTMDSGEQFEAWQLEPDQFVAPGPGLAMSLLRSGNRVFGFELQYAGLIIVYLR